MHTTPSAGSQRPENSQRGTATPPVSRRRGCGTRNLLASALLLSCALPRFAAAGVTDQYLDFDGVKDLTQVSSSTAISPTAAVTLEAWIRPDKLSSSTAQNKVVSKGTGLELTTSTGDTGCSYSTRGHVQWRVKIGGSDRRICGGTLTLGQWHHVAGTYSGSRVSLYVDGVLVAAANRSGSIAKTSTALTVGNRSDGKRAFDGAIDEVRFWNRALSANEVGQLRSLELSGQETGLVAYYRFNDGAGQFAVDASRTGRDLRLGSSSLADAADPEWVLPGGPVNAPPTVSAGSSVSGVAPDTVVALTGQVSDDGQPYGNLTTAWSTAQGPGDATFENPYTAATTATFPGPGTYRLRLSADDGELDASDDVTVTVASNAPPPTGGTPVDLLIVPNGATVTAGATVTFAAMTLDINGVPAAADVSWSDSAGAVSADGRFTAPSAPGAYTVWATAADLTRSVTVVVASQAPAWPGTSWTTVAPADVGMAAAKLAEAKSYALQGGGSGYVVRNGRLVYSWGTPTTTLYQTRSTTKSIGSALLGLAIEDGLVGLPDAAQTHLGSFGMPPDTNAATGWLGNITLRHLATQTAGFDKPGGFGALLYVPGTLWAYSDGGVNWLADILTVRYGQDLRTLLFNRVLSRIGVTTAALTWRSNQYRGTTINGITRREFGSGINATVDALARIGYLFLRQGNWQGQQLLPEWWPALVAYPWVDGLPVEQPASYPAASAHYGLLWWNNADSALPGVPRDAYWTWGLDESLIVVIPSLELVIARAGNGWATEWNGDYSRLEPFIRPIVESVIEPP